MAMLFMTLKDTVKSMVIEALMVLFGVFVGMASIGGILAVEKDGALYSACKKVHKNNANFKKKKEA